MLLKTQTLKLILLILFLSFLVYLGFNYRIRQYQIIPYPQHTFDEQGYLWLGKSILNTGIPANWSALYFYQNLHTSLKDKQTSITGYNISTDGKTPNLQGWSNFQNPLTKSIESEVDDYKSQFLIVQPYLDNPPLTGIIFALLDPNQSIYTSTNKYIRLIPIISLSFSLIAIFFLGKQLINFWSGLFASLIYALGPGFVVSSRIAVPENLIATLFPISLLTVLKYINRPSRLLLFILCLIVFLAPLIKVSGLIISLTLLFFLIQQKLFRAGFALGVSTTLGFLTYLLYGFFYNSQLFIQILQHQAQRTFQGPLTIFYQIFHPQVPAPFFDGWIILGYLVIFLILPLISRERPILLLNFATIIYLAFFMIFGGFNFPWYQFIIYPVLSLGLGVSLYYFIKNPRLEFNFAFFVITFSSLLHYANLTTKWLEYLNTYRIFIFIFLITTLIYFLYKPRGGLILKVSLILMFAFSLFLSTRIINSFQEIWPILLENKFNFLD